ncbi:MAG TPA: cation transporter [Nocardioidaceae bacterium]|jgi:cation diffusion facilitator family transporter
MAGSVSEETGTQHDTGRDERRQQEQGGGGESKLTVTIAFFANLAVALSKSIVALMTGSAAMMAEAAHSWADTGNQVLLVVAGKKAQRPPDESHPFGYGRESYIWSMFAAMGLFVAGGVVSVLEGIDKLLAGGEEASYTWAYVVLGAAFVFESVSFVQAFRQTRREAREYRREIVAHALKTSDPRLRAVFAEDSAALVGLVLAALGIFLHQVTGNVVFDALGSMLVGVVLLVVAVVLIQRNRVFLTGQETDRATRDEALGRMKGLPRVERVCYLRLEYVGPNQVFLIGSVDLTGDPQESEVAPVLRELEASLEEDPHVVEAVLTLAGKDEPSL